MNGKWKIQTTVHEKQLVSCAKYCCILTFGPGKHAIPKWCTGRKGHIPMASNRKRSRGRVWLMKSHNVKNPMVHSLTDAPEESDLCTAWQLFPLADDQPCHFKDWVGDWVGVELLYNSVKTRSQTVGDLRRDVVGKATPGRRGPRGARWS